MRNDFRAGKYPAENLNALTGPNRKDGAVDSNANGADKIPSRPCRICGCVFHALTFAEAEVRLRWKVEALHA